MLMFSTKIIQKKPLNEENILDKVSEYDIFRYYVGDFKIGKVFSSPLHKDDNPSFGIFAGKRDGKLMFNDYVKGGGSCFNLVMMMFNVDYWTALNIINNDMKLGLQSSSNASRVEKVYEKTNYTPSIKSINIGIKIRPWNSSDGLYWKEMFSISLKTLQKFKVIPISHYFINMFTIKCGPVAYAYYLDHNTYKIYQPNLPSHQGKFYTNVTVNTPWQGARQLPKEGGDILFITSSLKDVMVLHEAGYHAMAPHTEHQLLTQKVFDYYSSRWKKIIIFYDHDNAGIGHAQRWQKEYGLPYITTKSDFCKDPSDYVKMNNLSMLKELIKKELKKLENG